MADNISMHWWSVLVEAFGFSKLFSLVSCGSLVFCWSSGCRCRSGPRHKLCGARLGYSTRFLAGARRLTVRTVLAPRNPVEHTTMSSFARLSLKRHSLILLRAPTVNPANNESHPPTPVLVHGANNYNNRSRFPVLAYILLGAKWLHFKGSRLSCWMIHQTTSFQ